jgi:Mg-chelatase subunit ChlD
VPLSEKLDTERTARKERIRQEIQSLGASLARECDDSVVVDTQGRFTDSGEGRFLSEALGGGYMHLPRLLTENAPTLYFDE